MDRFVREYQPEKYASWMAGKDVGPHPENDQSRLYTGSRSRFVFTSVGNLSLSCLYDNIRQQIRLNMWAFE